MLDESSPRGVLNSDTLRTPFIGAYSPGADAGRTDGDVLAHGPAIDPPEGLIRALLLQIFFSVRSERQLMEQLDYNLLFRWFVGLEVDDAVWDASSFARNRDRLVDHEVGRSLLAAVVSQVRANDLVCVDDTGTPDRNGRQMT